MCQVPNTYCTKPEGLLHKQGK